MSEATLRDLKSVRDASAQQLRDDTFLREAREAIQAIPEVDDRDQELRLLSERLMREGLLGESETFARLCGDYPANSKACSVGFLHSPATAGEVVAAEKALATRLPDLLKVVLMEVANGISARATASTEYDQPASREVSS